MSDLSSLLAALQGKTLTAQQLAQLQSNGLNIQGQLSQYDPNAGADQSYWSSFDPAAGGFVGGNPATAQISTPLGSIGDGGAFGSYSMGLTQNPDGTYSIGSDAPTWNASNNNASSSLMDKFGDNLNWIGPLAMMAAGAYTGGLFSGGGSTGGLGITDAASLGGSGAVDASMYGAEGADMAAGGAAGGASGGASGLFGGLTGTQALTGGAIAASLLNRPSTPSTPDYTALANQQFQQQQDLLNQQTAANRYNQVTPNGNLTWTQDANGNWTQTQTLSPDQQAILNQQNQLSLGLSGAQNSMLGQLNQAYSTPFTGGSDAARQQTIDSQYNAMASRLDPQWAQKQSALETQLANQGLAPGGEAYTNAMRDFNYGRNDAYQQAQNQALQLGNNEFQNSFNRNLASYQQPMNMFNALRSGSQLQTPTYTNQNTSANLGQPANLTGAAQNQYSANLNTTNANNAYYNNLTNGLFNLAGTSLYGSYK